MKKLISLLLVLAMMFSLIACGTVEAAPTQGQTELVNENQTAAQT